MSEADLLHHIKHLRFKYQQSQKAKVISMNGILGKEFKKKGSPDFAYFNGNFFAIMDQCRANYVPQNLEVQVFKIFEMERNFTFLSLLEFESFMLLKVPLPKKVVRHWCIRIFSLI